MHADLSCCSDCLGPAATGASWPEVNPPVSLLSVTLQKEDGHLSWACPHQPVCSLSSDSVPRSVQQVKQGAAFNTALSQGSGSISEFRTVH